MSAASEAGRGAHSRDQAEGGHGSLKGYITGFLLSVALTAVPFWLVMGNVLGDPRLTGFVILGFAVAQIVAHMICFLHMNTTSEGGWAIMALIFTLTLVIIMMIGSVWVMYHLNSNMMPMSPGDMMHHAP